MTAGVARPAITRSRQPLSPSTSLSPNAADRGHPRLAFTTPRRTTSSYQKTLLQSGALTGLGVPPGAYERGNNFQQFVIRPAQLEVNGLSDMGVAIELLRRHARAAVHAVSLTWWRKEGDEFREAMRERKRSKVGRMARLRGEVEQLAADRVGFVNEDVAERLERMQAEQHGKLPAAD